MTFGDTLFSLLHKGGPTEDANIWRPMAFLSPHELRPNLCAQAGARALLAHEPCALRLHEAFDFPGI